MSSTNRRASVLFKLLTAAACCVGAASLWGEERKVITRFEIANDVIEATEVTVDSSNADLQASYLELHRQIAERLTPEQLTEKCKALEEEVSELIAEDQIEDILKQLSDLKRKNVFRAGIQRRLQLAIEALRGKTGPTGEEFKKL